MLEADEDLRSSGLSGRRIVFRQWLCGVSSDAVGSTDSEPTELAMAELIHAIRSGTAGVSRSEAHTVAALILLIRSKDATAEVPPPYHLRDVMSMADKRSRPAVVWKSDIKKAWKKLAAEVAEGAVPESMLMSRELESRKFVCR